MANKSNEIGDIVKKAKILLLDIEGTTTSISFVKDKLFPYVEENVQKFLEGEWENDDVKEAVSALRKLALEDLENTVEGVVKIPGEDATKEEQIEGLVGNVKWLMSADRKAGPLKQLQGLIWKQGYDNGDIKGHVYEDVSPALQQWRSVEGQKVYIYSSGSVQAQKLLFAQSLAGDLLKFIDGHFDTAVGAKQEEGSYKKIVEEIGCKAEEILFLTDILKEGEAARAAGLHVALLTREGNASLPDDVTATYPVLQSFAQLIVTNKRKPEQQDEPEQPAKVPKTEPETESEKTEASNEVTSAKTETGKMEVEDETGEDKTEEPKVDEPTNAKPGIEEVTDSNEPVDAPVCTAEPIVEEKQEESSCSSEEPEKMDIVAESVAPTKENGSAEAPVAEETPPTIVTEIKEITDETPVEVAEIIDDIVPVVEEPQTDDVDMAELQNVGEVLEKECDEILSKVQDVTNLDNIVVKPMLNTISEENMETENLDSNDIVERILDSEQELEAEMKQCGEIDLDTVSEVAEEKNIEIAKENAKEVQETSSAEKDTEPSSAEKNAEPSSAEQNTEPSSAEQNTEPSSAERNTEPSNAGKNTEPSSAEENTELSSADKNSETSSAEKITESCSTEKITESSSTEKITESSSTEKITESSSTEKITESSSTDKNAEPSSAEKNIDTKTEDAKVEESSPKETTDITEPMESLETATTALVAEENTEKADRTPEDKPESSEKDVPTETKVDEPTIAKENTPETKPDELKLNGNTSNGNGDALNGDASQDEAVNARLAADNGKETVNSANGKTNGSEESKEEKVEPEVTDIKVKTVAAAETRTEPIEQATEA